MQFSLNRKLMAVSIGLVVAPVVLIGGLILYEFKSFGRETAAASH